MELVASLLGGYDVVMSIDTDAMIMNHTLRVERLPVGGMVISEDLFGINDGVFLASNTPLVHQFFAVYLALRKHGNSQQMMTHLLATELYGAMVTKVPQREINSYRNHLYNRPEWFSGNFAPGDWICQWPGIAKEDRIPLMRAAQKEIIR